MNMKITLNKVKLRFQAWVLCILKYYLVYNGLKENIFTSINNSKITTLNE